jgi:hypothetical protein
MWTVAESLDSHRLLASSLAKRIVDIRIPKNIRKVAGLYLIAQKTFFKQEKVIGCSYFDNGTMPY